MHKRDEEATHKSQRADVRVCFHMCPTRGLAQAGSRNIAQAFSKKGVALDPAAGQWPAGPSLGGASTRAGVWDAKSALSPMAGETTASFIEAAPRAKALAPRGGGDVIPLPVYRCGLRAPGSWPATRTGSWARPRAAGAPALWPPGGGAAQGTRQSLQSRVGRRCQHQHRETTGQAPFSSSQGGKSQPRQMSETAASDPERSREAGAGAGAQGRRL